LIVPRRSEYNLTIIIIAIIATGISNKNIRADCIDMFIIARATPTDIAAIIATINIFFLKHVISVILFTALASDIKDIATITPKICCIQNTLKPAIAATKAMPKNKTRSMPKKTAVFTLIISPLKIIIT
jgi:hypothetical protein